MKITRRRRERPRVIGPLCEAWEAEGVGEYWPDCYHGSCWSVVYGQV